MANKGKNPAAVQLGSRGGKARSKSISAQERRRIASKAGKAYWASMTKEQRSAEMKRRAAKRKKPAKK